jgi:hypothetical protein
LVGLYPQSIISVLRVTVAHVLLLSMPPEITAGLTPEQLFG